MNRNAKVVAILVAAAATPSMVFGLGVRLPDQDAFATGRGEAFAATADNPSAIYYNPAGITQLDGVNARVGLYGISIYDHQYSTNGAAHTVDGIQAVPQLFFTAALKDVPVTLGLGAYAPFGLSMHWPQDTSFDNLGVKGSINYFTVNPVIAWQVIPSLSIAAGPTINYATADLQYDLTLVDPMGQFQFKGNDIAPGFNVGLRWQPLDQVAFGAGYRSATTMGFHGTASYTGQFGDNATSSTASFNFPQSVVGGVSWRPSTNWNLEFNADWTDWSSLKTVTLNATPVIPGIGVNVPGSSAYNWSPSWFFEWGLTRYFENGLHASAGYIYSMNSVPDSTYNPLIPDSDRHIWSLGLGGKWRRLSWDAAYQLAWGPPRTVTGAPSQQVSLTGTTQSANGTYEFLSHAIIVSIGYHF